MCMYMLLSVCVCVYVPQTLMLWSLPQCEAIGVLRGHEHVVECVAFSSMFHDSEIKKKVEVSAITVPQATSLMC